MDAQKKNKLLIAALEKIAQEAKKNIPDDDKIHTMATSAIESARAGDEQ